MEYFGRRFHKRKNRDSFVWFFFFFCTISLIMVLTVAMYWLYNQCNVTKKNFNSILIKINNLVGFDRYYPWCTRRRHNIEINLMPLTFANAIDSILFFFSSLLLFPPTISSTVDCDCWLWASVQKKNRFFFSFLSNW